MRATVAPTLIDKQKDLIAVCERLRQSGAPVAFDTEFISERRYAPRLCLVQVYAAWGEESCEAIIDPFAVDLKPLLQLIADPAVTKIVHAGGQDLAIFAQEFGCRATHVFDTQIAAAFLGHGHQIGYAEMVRRLLDGLQLSKEMQFTDWASRPLTKAQIEYALSDVRYLPEIYMTLRAELVERGRLVWAKAEFRRAEVKATQTPKLDELYRRFNLAGLSRRRLGALRELAAERELIARGIDKPPSFIVSDPVLLQLAKQMPLTVAEIRAQRGMPSISGEQANRLLAALQRAADLPEDDLPERGTGERPDPRSEAVVALLGVVAQARSVEHDISRTYLAPREQLAALASWWLRGEDIPLDLPLLDDWRGELLGTELLDVLHGRMAVALDAAAPQQSTERPVVRVLSLANPE